jgi:hypothetical protein
MKYVPLTNLEQLRTGNVLVDHNGNRRIILKRFPGSRQTLVQLSHKNTLNPGSVWRWKDLMKTMDRVETHH